MTAVNEESETKDNNLHLHEIFWIANEYAQCCSLVLRLNIPASNASCPSTRALAI